MNICREKGIIVSLDMGVDSLPHAMPGKILPSPPPLTDHRASGNYSPRVELWLRTPKRDKWPDVLALPALGERSLIYVSSLCSQNSELFATPFGQLDTGLKLLFAAAAHLCTWHSRLVCLLLLPLSKRRAQLGLVFDASLQRDLETVPASLPPAVAPFSSPHTRFLGFPQFTYAPCNRMKGLTTAQRGWLNFQILLWMILLWHHSPWGGRQS